jgi:general secretion pathway protein A
VYTQFFGLTEKPFSITPDPRYLYLSRRHADALAHLLYGISQSGGFIQLTGEVGTGKTTLVRSLFEQLPEEADVALILNPELTTLEFLRAISEELGVELPNNDSIKSLVDHLSAHLLDAHAKGRRTVLIVDEAQNLATDVLEQVRLLTNLETPKQKLLQIILIGQPELREVLDREDMRQLAQRVTGRYHLEPLSQDETAIYLEHRMKVAGAAGAIFSKSAVKEIFRWSNGVPRIINVISDRALLAAYTKDTRDVDKALVKKAATEVYGKRLVPHVERRLAAAIAFAGLVLLLIGTWLTLNPDNGWLPIQLGQVPGFTLGQESAGDSRDVSLALLLEDQTLPRGTDAAFDILFGLWGAQYQRGSETACQQAEKQYLRCWFQKGSLNHLKRLNRPAILGLIDQRGDQYQVVLSSLGADVAELTIGSRRYSVSAEDLSQYWFGDHLLLWRPGAWAEQTLTPGMQDDSVRWLRESLALIDGKPLNDSESEFYDDELAHRVREYQRERRLTVDGIVGTQTQIAINSDLAIVGTPFLMGAP